MDRLLDQNSFAASMTSSALLLPQSAPAVLCCLPSQYGVQGVQPPQSVISQSTGHAILATATAAATITLETSFGARAVWDPFGCDWQPSCGGSRWPIFLDYCTQALNKSRHKSAQMPTCKQKRFELGDMRHKMLLTLALQLVQVRRS